MKLEESASSGGQVGEATRFVIERGPRMVANLAAGTPHRRSLAVGSLGRAVHQAPGDLALAQRIGTIG